MSSAYHDFYGIKDPRMSVYPLMDYPLKTFLFSAVYLSFVKVIGPAWMKNRRPYELRTLMVIYNAFLVVLSGWLFVNFGIYGWFTTYSWRCEPIDRSSNPYALKMVYVCWIFYLSKFFEFADTVFFILRKKDAQINFLHVFHHTIVPITAWYGVAYGPGGYNTIFCTLNSFVHIWMYLYYGLSALGPSVQKYLWWKKYLTTLQLIQFVGVLLFYTQVYLFPKENCKVHGFLVAISVVQGIIFLFLFLHFYKNSYKKNPLQKYHTASKSHSENGAINIGTRHKEN